MKKKSGNDENSLKSDMPAKPSRAELFQAVNQPEKSDAAKREEEILAFWEQNEIFEKSLAKDAPKGEFVFYDGPPFATGLPHSGSLLSSVSKDLMPRYKTMRGYSVRRRWGWDTHGLPIESAVEKKLGLKNKKDILALGIENFNETARSLVLEYVSDWKRYIDRVGRWVDFDDSYKTMDASFMESVWWGLKQIHEKGHLYEGRKVLMYCPHCETPLAKAEIAMDNTYKDVTEEAVTVKFKVKDPAGHGLPENTFILAWTTTPWTLPGNVGLAVKDDIQYGLYEKEEEHFILAKDLAEKNGLDKIIREFSGTELVGIQYEPLYEIPKAAAHSGKKWEVIAADFVTAEDGTGIVHTAVIYGEDDYTLGVKENLPMVQLLNGNGTYNDDAPEFIRGQYIKKAEPLIKEDLEKRGLLFAKAMNTHSYPHCYRCGTALIYNAVSSWFINIQEVKEQMLKENESINWMPAHLKEGRFHRNLETAPDWTISRNRFWATPLPIWKDSAGKVTVLGSLDELKERTKKSGNQYFIMRHGEAENNLQAICNTALEHKDLYHLTDLGRETVRKNAESLKDAGIEVIIASPFARTFETARIVAETIGFDPGQIIIDNSLGEINVGINEGKSLEEYHAYFETLADRFTKSPEGGETFVEVRRRVGAFLYELEEKYKGKNILMVSHGDPLWMMKMAAAGMNASCISQVPYLEKGQIEPLPFVPLPHNADYELDFHLPYIDRVMLEDGDGNALTRIPEVVDCWVESGSMPFAEYHYPFENKDQFEKRSPGDFVSEYIGQTRAWFYYMHAMSVNLFGRAAFRNVVTTGTILAADGEKISKSKQNYTDPYVIFDRFSADAFRYYLMSSVVMQAEDLTFRDDEVKEVQNRVVNMLRNVLAFYTLFKSEASESQESEGDLVLEDATQESTHPLDRWILSRLAEVIQNATDSFDRFDVPRATRPMREFIDDLSTWYVRRSRDRIKADDTNGTDADKQHALVTLRFVLREFSKCIAPVMPFIAEEIFQEVKGPEDAESVHLASWPGAGVPDVALHEEMALVRSLSSEALMLRQKSGIKVRQPLASLSIPGSLPPELLTLIADEINVKEIYEEAEEMKLDTELTPELVREGDVREFMRALSEARKEMGLIPQDQVSVTIAESAKEILEPQGHAQIFAGVSSMHFGDASGSAYSVTFSSGVVPFGISKTE
jgi:isoleucyl-tRNA synthetase